MLRLIDPYALAMSFLVGSVGFGMTFYFNTNFSSWGMEEIAYPAAAIIYVYVRNGRFQTDNGKKSKQRSAKKEKEANRGAPGYTDDGVPEESLAIDQDKIMAPLPAVGIPGVHVVAGAPLSPLKEDALTVVFFWATWCTNSEKCLPALLAMAGRYSEEGVSFAGVTQESEDDLRYFLETYQRSTKSVIFVADEEGNLTHGYQGAHGLKTIPHCYIVRGLSSKDSTPNVLGTVEWHGHPTRLEAALNYILESEAEEDGDMGSLVGR